MTILLVRTDQPQAELYLYHDGALVGSYEWQAHRQLSDTLLTKVKELLADHGLGWADIQAAGVFAGPGSFTGLRIGHTFINALGYGQDVPVANAAGDNWVQDCLSQLEKVTRFEIITPDYGRPARITTQKK